MPLALAGIQLSVTVLQSPHGWIEVDLRVDAGRELKHACSPTSLRGLLNEAQTLALLRL
jgi:hypothetical protein